MSDINSEDTLIQRIHDAMGPDEQAVPLPGLNSADDMSLYQSQLSQELTGLLLTGTDTIPTISDENVFAPSNITVHEGKINRLKKIWEKEELRPTLTRVGELYLRAMGSSASAKQDGTHLVPAIQLYDVLTKEGFEDIKLIHTKPHGAKEPHYFVAINVEGGWFSLDFIRDSVGCPLPFVDYLHGGMKEIPYEAAKEILSVGTDLADTVLDKGLAGNYSDRATGVANVN
ncbi:hypothetical protein HOF46_01530 [Candidatus Woesearchaeota archaeon]|jgi:hypothetical protein|nr:hypothetical protein [Candidatus Woesearchaeota archaeon]